jgi:RNA polymerase sigma factor (sigma-70 family)
MGNSTSERYFEIIQGFRLNDENVLKRFYQKVYPKAKLFVLQNSGNEEQAKDIFQESFIACWRNIKDDKVEHHENIEAYLFKITKNKWIDHLRSAKFRNTVSINGLNEFAQNFESETDHDELESQRNMIQEALQQIDENCRTILNLYYFKRLSMKEISKHFGIDPASARNKKYRCMENLRSLTLKTQNNE